jgi:hypothetical protein
MNTESLIAKIKSTNNGYLFAPTTAEIKLARAYPEKFLIVNTNDYFFHTNISLK